MDSWWPKHGILYDNKAKKATIWAIRNIEENKEVEVENMEGYLNLSFEEFPSYVEEEEEDKIVASLEE